MSQGGASWPTYYSGWREHLHALGVVAVNLASFEEHLEILYLDYAEAKGANRADVQKSYLGSNEKDKLKLIPELFRAHSTDQQLQQCIENLVEYYGWAIFTRNHLLHSQLYPQGILRRDDTIKLTKRRNKKSTDFLYMSFTLEHIREIADNIRDGLKHAIDVDFYIKYHGKPDSKIPVQRRPYVPHEVPKPLLIPSPIVMTCKP